MNEGALLSNKRLRESKRDKTSDPRNDFESDFGRIIFSPAIRRMHDKTQVFPLTTDDNIHSRLTHSMEVMAIGYSLGLKLCENDLFLNRIDKDKNEVVREIPIILKNACLVHDIGNPPFGHFGETAIKNYFITFFDKNIYGLELSGEQKNDFMLFDGNAQGFRVLTKLQVLEDTYGLNLTYATLSTYLKYPNTSFINKQKLSCKKRGVFQSEKAYLHDITLGCGLYRNGEIIRHPLSFLMEAADSICYLVMDIEDGFNKGWYDFKFIKEKLIDIPGIAEIIEIIEKEFITEIGKIVNLRIKLIAKLVNLAMKNFINNFEEIYNGNYNNELIYDDSNNLADTLNKFCRDEIFSKKEIEFLELTGDSVITGLLDYYTKYLFHKNNDYRNKALNLISHSIRKASLFENDLELGDFAKLNDYYKLRVIVDFISGMTDQYALNYYRKLNGQKII